LGSSGNYTQENRLISIDTPLGDDVLLLAHLSGYEAVSRLFKFNLDLLSEKKNISFDQIVGQQVTISMQLADGVNERYFNGYVSRFAQTGTDVSFTHYQMEVVPWLWFLTRNANCRIFQNKTIPQIIEQVFEDRGFSSNYRTSFNETYDEREYCVQYRETDFAFVSRLMEQYGICYFFEHTEDDHKLVLTDNKSGFQPCPVESAVRYSPGAQSIEGVVTGWQIVQELKTGKYSLGDYNFETPTASMLGTENTVVEVDSNTKYETYDYPGIYETQSDGTAVAKLRMQEEEASHLVGTGTGTCRTLAAGYLFDFDEHDRAENNKEYLLTEVRHVASSAGTYVTSGTESHYSNQFACIDSAIPFRPARVTPLPFVHGPQTAVVVGPSGEEIYVDNYGRVKVQFFWDREGENDDKSSCWIRVSHPWAGESWGAMFLPRIGQEVIVSFLEGDPDRPIITGRVYNADQTVPYPLPDNQNQSGFRSRSTKGGGSDNFNEIRFDDTMGSERYIMQAEKDMSISVKNDCYEEIKSERHLTVAKDQVESVGGDLHIGVTGNINQKAGQNMSLQVTQGLTETSMTYSHQAQESLYLKAAQVVIEADAMLTIKVGGNYVTINPAMVAITGTLVNINTGGSPGSGSAGSATSPKDPTKPNIDI